MYVVDKITPLLKVGLKTKPANISKEDAQSCNERLHILDWEVYSFVLYSISKFWMNTILSLIEIASLLAVSDCSGCSYKMMLGGQIPETLIVWYHLTVSNQWYIS